MILSEVVFCHSDLPLVVEHLLKLPESFRPTHHKLGEGESSQPIVDPQSYLDTLKTAGLGPMLKGHDVEYDVQYFDGFIGDEAVRSSSITVRCWFDSGASEVGRFMTCVAQAEPIFAFACAEEEFRHRHCVTKEAAYGTHTEAFGTDWTKYVPGIYWLTLVSSELANRHGISIGSLEAESRRVVGGPPGHLVLEFFENPVDWASSAVRLDEVCKTCDGIFSLEPAREAFMNASTFLETEVVGEMWP